MQRMWAHRERIENSSCRVSCIVTVEVDNVCNEIYDQSLTTLY